MTRLHTAADSCRRINPHKAAVVMLNDLAGSGTTLMAASELGRDSIGIDLDERNLELAQARCGMFLTEEATA